VHANISCLTVARLGRFAPGLVFGHQGVEARTRVCIASVAMCTEPGLLSCVFSPMHMSVQGNHEEVSRLLIQYKSPIDDVTVDSLTPLHVAAHCGNVETAKVLLENKCTVDSRALVSFCSLCTYRAV
jgi:hypothetical protein